MAAGRKAVLHPSPQGGGCCQLRKAGKQEVGVVKTRAERRHVIYESSRRGNHSRRGSAAEVKLWGNGYGCDDERLRGWKQVSAIKHCRQPGPTIHPSIHPSRKTDGRQVDRRPADRARVCVCVCVCVCVLGRHCTCLAMLSAHLSAVSAIRLDIRPRTRHCHLRAACLPACLVHLHPLLSAWLSVHLPPISRLSISMAIRQGIYL